MKIHINQEQNENREEARERESERRERVDKFIFINIELDWIGHSNTVSSYRQAEGMTPCLR